MSTTGLDQYLRAKKYVSGYEFAPEADQAVYRKLLDEFDAAEIADPDTPSAEVSFTAAYWRKANAIHRWFVENVQDGKDECDPYYVGREQLERLKFECQVVLKASKVETGTVVTGYSINPDGSQEPLTTEGRVVANPAVAEEHLPTQEGFFFGSVEYDEWYLRDLEDTVRQIDRVLKATADGDWSFEYQSSW